jgi:hypothetical protein
MEHLSAFQITNEELDISRRVVEGELNLEAAMGQLQEMFQRMPTSRRPSGGPAGPDRTACYLFGLPPLHYH